MIGNQGLPVCFYSTLSVHTICSSHHQVLAFHFMNIFCPVNKQACVILYTMFHLFHRHPYYQLLYLVLSTTVTPTCVAMLSESRWRGLRHTLLVLFSATLLIGITMLAISSEINPIGVFFLVAGGLCLVGYLISVAAEQCLKHQNPGEEAQAAPRRQNHNG